MKLLGSSLGRLAKLASRSLSTGANSTTTTAATEKGLVFDIKPVKFTSTEGKTYFWCSCGESKKQPFCDGTHKRPDIKLRPVKWECTESKAYFICNCKQTNKAPFCDATHVKSEVVETFKKQQKDGKAPDATPK